MDDIVRKTMDKVKEEWEKVKNKDMSDERKVKEILDIPIQDIRNIFMERNDVAKIS